MTLALAAADTISGVAGSATSITYTISGDEITSSGDAFKVLAQGQLAASAGTLYTVPSSTSAIVKSIHLANPTAGAVTAKLTVKGTAAANVILPAISIEAGGFAVFGGDGWVFYNSSGQRLGEGAKGDTGAAGADGADGTNTITVAEDDGSPSVSDVDTLKFDKDDFTVTDNSDGSVTVASTGTGGGSALTVEEADGSPTDSAVTKLIFPNSSLSITSHEATITFPSGSGGSVSEDWWHHDNKPASPSAYDREFTEGTTVGTLTRAAHGTPKGTWAEVRGGLTWTHTVTGSGIELDVYAQARTCSIGDYVTIAARMPSSVPAYMGPFCGFSNGATFGTSNAVGSLIYFPTATNYRGLLNQYPGMNSRAADGSTGDGGVPGQVMGWRVKYEAANTWGLYMRWPGSNGWKKIQSNYSYTLSPTHVLFGVHVFNSAAYSADNGADIRLECFRVND